MHIVRYDVGRTICARLEAIECRWDKLRTGISVLLAVFPMRCIYFFFWNMGIACNVAAVAVCILLYLHKPFYYLFFPAQPQPLWVLPYLCFFFGAFGVFGSFLSAQLFVKTFIAMLKTEQQKQEHTIWIRKE